MKPNEYYIDITNYIFNNNVTLNDIDSNIICNSNGLIVSIDLKAFIADPKIINIGHVVSFFECNNKPFYYDDNEPLEKIDMKEHWKNSTAIKIFEYVKYMYNSPTIILKMYSFITLQKTKYTLDSYKKLNIAELLRWYDFEIIEKCINNENKIITNNFNSTPLHMALNIKIQNIEVIKKLIDNEKLTLRIQDNNGNTPLYIALLREYNKTVIDLLIDSENNVLMIQNSDNVIPLHFALNIEIQDIEVIKKLIDNKELILRMQDNDGNTPLHVALLRDYNKTIIDLLIDCESNVLMIQNSDNEIPLHLALNINMLDIEVIKKLINMKTLQATIKGKSLQKFIEQKKSSETESSKKDLYIQIQQYIVEYETKSKSNLVDGGNNKYKFIPFHHCY
jgi:ankyrin repeat protein